MLKTRYFLCALTVFLGACASKPTMEDVQKSVAKADEVRAKAEDDRRKKRQVQAEEFLDVVPKWALEAPKPDGTGLYAIGSAESDSLNVSQKKSVLDAEFGLAKLYRQELSGSERNFTQERNDRTLNSQFTAVIDKLVARVPVVGFEVVKQEVKAFNGAYHTWVLLRLPYAQFNKVLQEQKADSMDSTVREAFDDLERRVKARQEERQRDAKAQQELRLSELQARSDLVNRGAAASQPQTETVTSAREVKPSVEIAAKSTVTPVVVGATEVRAPAVEATPQ